MPSAAFALVGGCWLLFLAVIGWLLHWCGGFTVIVTGLAGLSICALANAITQCRTDEPVSEPDE